MRLRAEVSSSYGNIVLRCSGKIIYGSEVDEIAQEVLKLKPVSRRVIIDLREVAELRSGDLGMLWLRYMEARAHGWQLAFVNLPPVIRELLERHCVDEAFEIYDTPQQAMSRDALVQGSVA